MLIECSYPQSKGVNLSDLTFSVHRFERKRSHPWRPGLVFQSNCAHPSVSAPRDVCVDMIQNGKSAEPRSPALSDSLTEAMLAVRPVGSLSQLVIKWEEGSRACADGRWCTTRRIRTDHTRLVGAERTLTRLARCYRLRARFVNNVRGYSRPEGGRSRSR